MAGADRMTIEEVVKQVMLDEQADVLRSAVEAVCAELMELEVAQQIGAERGERRPDDRMAHRNGYRAREWQTRAGTRSTSSSRASGLRVSKSEVSRICQALDEHVDAFRTRPLEGACPSSKRPEPPTSSPTIQARSYTTSRDLTAGPAARGGVGRVVRPTPRSRLTVP